MFTAMPPAFHVPTRPMTNWGTFCRYRATRSPQENPESSSPAASASPAPVVSQLAGVVVQLFASAGECWYVTLVIPEPPVSLVVEASVTVPLRFAPGSFIVAPGAVLSTRIVTAAEFAALPAASVVTVLAPRKVWPSPKPVASHDWLEKNSTRKVELGVELSAPVAVVLPPDVLTFVSTG